MEKNTRALTVCLSIVFIAGVLKAQPRPEVTVGVMIIDANSGRAASLASTTASEHGTAADLLHAILMDSAMQVRQSPTVHAFDDQKVTLRIAENNPNALIVELTPHLHGRDEIGLRIGLEVRNAVRTVDLFGLRQYVMAEQRNDADIRLRDGEVSLLSS